MYGAADNDPTLSRIEREMAATVAEFEHGLSLGSPAEVESSTDGRYRIRHEDVELDIAVSPCGQRRIGALSLPLLRVVYEFHGGTLDQRRRLLARLDLAMQRGGG